MPCIMEACPEVNDIGFSLSAYSTHDACKAMGETLAFRQRLTIKMSIRGQSRSGIIVIPARPSEESANVRAQPRTDLTEVLFLVSGICSLRVMVNKHGIILFSYEYLGRFRDCSVL